MSSPLEIAKEIDSLAVQHNCSEVEITRRALEAFKLFQKAGNNAAQREWLRAFIEACAASDDGSFVDHLERLRALSAGLRSNGWSTVEVDLAGAPLRVQDITFAYNRIVESAPPNTEIVNLIVKNVRAKPYPGLPGVDEPYFPVLGRDQLAQATIVHWIERATAAGVPEEKLERARQRYQEIVVFQSDHPERVKVPD